MAAVGLAIGVPRLGGPPASPLALPVPEDACPTTPPRLPAEPADRPGQLVPTGAVRVALCQTAIQAEPSPAAQLLSTGVDSLVSLLNALPGLPAGATWRCAAVGYRYATSLLFRYPDREPVLVQVDRNCHVAQVDGRTRAYSGPGPIEWFEDLYRGQLAAQVDPATIAAPECPQTLATAGGPRDDISQGKGLDGQALPTELAAATFCRYFGTRSLRHRRCGTGCPSCGTRST